MTSTNNLNKLDILEHNITSVKKDISILKSYNEFNKKEQFYLRSIINGKLKEENNNDSYGIFMNIYFILKGFTWWISFICRLLFNIIGLIMCVFMFKELIYYTYNKIILLSYYPTNDIGWTCNYKVLNIPIAFKNNTCDFNYVQCSYFNKILYIEPSTKETFNTTISLYDYAIEQTKKTQCTNIGTVKIITNNKIKTRIWIDSNTIIKNNYFYYNYTFVCDLSLSPKSLINRFENPLVINQEVLSILNHKLYDNIIDEVSTQCSN